MTIHKRMTLPFYIRNQLHNLAALERNCNKTQLKALLGHEELFKALVEISYNVLYNHDLSLMEREKRLLKPWKSKLLTLANQPARRRAVLLRSGPSLLPPLLAIILPILHQHVKRQGLQVD